MNSGIFSILALAGNIASAGPVPETGNGHGEFRPAQYSEHPLPATIQTGARSFEAHLLGIRGAELEVHPLDAANPAERIFIPLMEMEKFKITCALPPVLRESLENTGKEGFTPEEIALLRPVIWPMIRHLGIPAASINIHPFIDAYLEGLIERDEMEEAYAMILKVPLHGDGAVYIRHALDLAGKLVEKPGFGDRGLILLGRIPVDDNRDELIDLIFHYARYFRERGKLDEALILYERIRSIPETGRFKEALLWTAYCSARLDRVESARLFIGKARPIQTGEHEFSLRQLVLARIALGNQQFERAMEAAARGVVYSRIDYEWIPELLYLSGLCYEALGNLRTAQTLYEQLTLFFPARVWAIQGRQRLRELSDAEESGDSPARTDLTNHSPRYP